MPFERFFENYPESSLEIEILQLVFDRLGYTDEDDFYEDYEGCMTEKELIEKQEEFYDRENLGDYLHDLAKYYTYPTEDLHCYHWWDITDISEIDKISREQRLAEKSADEWLKTIFLIVTPYLRIILKQQSGRLFVNQSIQVTLCSINLFAQ